MRFIGIEFLESLLPQIGFTAKMVFNQHGAIFFPAGQQHRDHKAEGISYADDYAGSALAAMLTPSRIEIRFHRDFTDVEVARILQDLLAEPRLAPLRAWQILYQGRGLTIK